MATYGLGVLSLNNGAAQPAAEIRATSANKPRLMELHFTQTAAPTAAATYGLGRPAAIGIAPVTTTYEQDETDLSNVNALANVAVAWGTAPTVPANFFRRCSVNNVIGAGAIWVFPRGVLIGFSSSLVLWIITTNTPSQLNINPVVDE